MAKSGHLSTSAVWSFRPRCADCSAAVYLHTNGIDTSTLAGKAMFQMLGVFAELERGIIVERIKAGVARAQGKYMCRPRIDAKLEQRTVSVCGPVMVC
jgi:DNA invertase Pin-like site-specific DNA recombinase